MPWTTGFCSVAASASVAGVLTLALILPARAEDQGGEASPPKVSKFAPAGDLVRQAEQYIKTIQEDTASADQYKDSKEEIARTSNTLAVIALALGLHDEDNKYKAAAPAILNAAQEVAAATDFAAAKKAAKKLTGPADIANASLKWTKVASLEQLMKQVPLLNTKLKKNVKGTRLKSKAKETAGLSAVIAVIAQGSLANTAEAKATTPELVDQWRKFSNELRDAAAAVNKGIHAGNRKATDKAMVKLAQSCDDCHDVFNKEAKEKMEKAE